MIAAGYQRCDVWEMTPREIAGCLYFAERRRKHQAAENLMLTALASRGESRDLKRQIESLQRD